MTWISQELSSLDLGDARRASRVIRMVERMSDRPSGSIPETFETHAEAKAAYRALSSEAVDAQALRDAVHQACVGRLGEERLVLAVQDTTSFDFTSHPATGAPGNGPRIGPYFGTCRPGGVPLGPAPFASSQFAALPSQYVVLTCSSAAPLVHCRTYRSCSLERWRPRRCPRRRALPSRPTRFGYYGTYVCICLPRRPPAGPCVFRAFLGQIRIFLRPV